MTSSYLRANGIHSILFSHLLMFVLPHMALVVDTPLPHLTSIKLLIMQLAITNKIVQRMSARMLCF